MFPLYSQKCQSIIVKPCYRLFQDQIQSTSSHGVQHPWLCNRAPATSATRGPCCDAWLVGKGWNKNNNDWTNMKTIWWNIWSRCVTLCANDCEWAIISGRRHVSGYPKWRILGDPSNNSEPIKNKHDKWNVCLNIGAASWVWFLCVCDAKIWVIPQYVSGFDM